MPVNTNIHTNSAFVCERVRVRFHRRMINDLYASDTERNTSASVQAYLADVLTRLVDLWPNNRLDELLPWA